MSLNRPRRFRLNEEVVLWYPPGASSPIILPRKLNLDSYYVSGLIEVPKLTTLEWKQLENVLGKGIPKGGQKAIKRAICHFVTYYGLYERKLALSEIKRRLDEIKAAGERLLRLCGANPVDFRDRRKKKPIERGVKRHILSVSQVVNRSLHQALPSKSGSLIEYLRPVCALIEVCERRLAEIAKPASKRGPKADTGLKYLVKVLVFVACKVMQSAEFKLPSPNTKKYDHTNYPLLHFVRSTISIGAEKGLKAIAASPKLSPDEKQVAKKFLNGAADPEQRRGILDLVRAYQLAERKQYA